MKALPALLAQQALPVCDQNDFVVLAANTVETIAVPAGAKYMLVQTTTVVSFLFDADPPNVADKTDGTAGMMVNPNAPPLPIELPVPLPTNVRFNAPGTPTVGVSFYGPQ